MLALLLSAVCYAGEIERAFANDDAPGVQRLYTMAETRPDSLLALYRLVSLTEDASILEDIPDELDESAQARELAWLSGLWGFRAQNAGLLKKPKYGAASIRLIEAAERLDPEDPWVLLVSGQSYLYRPGIIGGSADEAQARFDTLVSRLSAEPMCGLPLIEARIWTWMVLKEDERPGADSLRAELLATEPRPRYRLWLEEG